MSSAVSGDAFHCGVLHVLGHIFPASMEELAKEGNAVEADAVEGVEDGKAARVPEVTTREVPEDDVPPST